MKNPIAWMRRRRGRNAATVDGYTGPRTKVAVVGYAAAPHLPELPDGMAWAIEYISDNTFAVSLYRRRTRLGAYMAPLCELRVETVIAMARGLNRRRAYFEGSTK